MKVGFIGLGNMGFGMVSNLLKNGYGTIVYDIDNEKVIAIESKGAQKIDTIEELSKSVETVILCLPHPNISKKVIATLLNSASKVTTIIDTSTLTPQSSQEIHDQLQAKKVHFLCSPMLGGKNAAENQVIHFLVEGEKENFNEFKELFSAMGKRTDYMGDIPNATVAKLAYNICRYGNIALAVEVTRFVRKNSKETQSIYQLLEEGSLDNFGQVWSEDIKNMILEGIDYKPSKIPEKDLSLIVELAKNEGLSDNLFEAIKNTYTSLAK